MKTFEEIEQSSELFNFATLSGIDRKQQREFWRHFVRYRQDFFRFSECLRVDSRDDDSPPDAEGAFYRAIKRNPSLSILERYREETASHYLVSYPSRLREPKFSRMVSAGFVLSITDEGHCTALPFVAVPQADVRPRWLRLIGHSGATLLGTLTVPTIGVLLYALFWQVDVDSEQLLLFGVTLPLVATLLFFGLRALRGEYIAFKMGMSPVEAELQEASEAAGRILEIIRCAETS
jgi:hypothetical protein